ncbi:MAG: type IV toxin-antitoxin system AbiEi family antitoxin domain-containing protein [Mycobacterium sp.]
MFIDELFEANNGVATYAQLLTVMSRKAIASHLRKGAIVRVCHGIYSLGIPDTAGRLAAFDLSVGKSLVACMSTAADLYGFGIESSDCVHVLDPGVRVRPKLGLMVHQRVGAPLQRVGGRLTTAPAWTAIELARSLARPRALATLDAALRCGACTLADVDAALRQQHGRRGVVKVRELLPLADARAESPMESEMRLVFIDGGLPTPELQYEIVDRSGQVWRVDFAWPGYKVAAEYDSVDWHANTAAFKHDRMKAARLQECGWASVPAVVDDVRRYPDDLCARIVRQFEQAALAG